MITNIQNLQYGDFFQFKNGNKTYRYITEEYENGLIISIYEDEQGRRWETEYNSEVRKG